MVMLSFIINEQELRWKYKGDFIANRNKRLNEVKNELKWGEEMRADKSHSYSYT